MKNEKILIKELINKYDSTLNDKLNQVLCDTGISNIHSLHGKIGGKHAIYIDIKNEIILSPEHFASLWLQGLKRKINFEGKNQAYHADFKIYDWLKNLKSFREYTYIFLKRTYLRYYESLSKKRPLIDDAQIWIGQTNANYGILITPRFKNGNWENDKSEIRHFKHKYWSIGHIMETGLVIPYKKSKIEFNDINQYLTFFKDVIVRNSGSKHEYAIAELYCKYINSSSNPEEIPLLIPEFRFNGLEAKHQYRLDFTIIESSNLNKIGVEISPWSSHGYLSKIKLLSQKEINEIAKSNFENEMKKHKDFFRKHGIFTLIYTDRDLIDYNVIFDDLLNYLKAEKFNHQIEKHILHDFFMM